MKEQNLANHRQIVPAYHMALIIPILILIIGASVSVYDHWYNRLSMTIPGLILLAGFLILGVAFFARKFALVAQDRAIRAEENLRHFALTGNLLDSSLKPAQIVALRFAPDSEFPGLAQRAAEQKLYPKQIKESIKNWRADHYRV